MMLRSLAVAAALFATPALAADRQFSNGEAVAVQPDRGYILVRTFRAAGPALSGTLMPTPLLVRVLTAADVARARALEDADPDHWTDTIEPNVAEPLADKPYALVNNEEYLLVSVTPGTYVLGGLAMTSWAAPSVGFVKTSLCMGTVKFEVIPGTITDMGALVAARDDEPTDIAELSGVVVGRPIGSRDATPYTMALRPGATDVPAGLAALPRVAADYRAVDTMINYLSAPLSRLAPLPGVLAYDKDGKVIDLKAGAKP